MLSYDVWRKTAVVAQRYSDGPWSPNQPPVQPPSQPPTSSAQPPSQPTQQPTQPAQQPQANPASALPGWIQTVAPWLLGIGGIISGVGKTVHPERDPYLRAEARKTQKQPVVLAFDPNIVNRRNRGR